MEVRVNLADLVLSLRFADERARAEMSGFFEGFQTTAEPDGILEVDWTELDEADLPETSQVEMPVGRVLHRHFTCSWYYYDGDYHLDEGRGACRVRGWFGLQKFLWALMTVLLPERDGLVLHAASLSDGERGYLFPAPSGTGKSTLVRNSPDKTVLSDEGTLVRFVDGVLCAYGSPLRSDAFRDFGYRRVPVAGVYFLEQAPEDRLEPMRVADALQRLLLETFLFVDHPPARVQSFRMADRILGAADPFVLKLVNGPTFWRCIQHDIQHQART